MGYFRVLCPEAACPHGAQDRMTLLVERLTCSEAFNELRPEWELLDARLWPRTPFSSPLWNQLWWKHFGTQGFTQKHEFFLHTLRDSEGQLVAVAPLMLTRRPSFGPLRIR